MLEISVLQELIHNGEITGCRNEICSSSGAFRKKKCAERETIALLCSVGTHGANSVVLRGGLLVLIAISR